MGTYLTAQVCLNGHVLTDSLERSPEMAAAHCADCGSPTISECPKCGAKIRGELYNEGVIVAGWITPAPKFCFHCGVAFPWHAAKIEAARELAEELDDLSADDREKLKTAISDLASNRTRSSSLQDYGASIWMRAARQSG